MKYRSAAQYIYSTVKMATFFPFFFGANGSVLRSVLAQF